MKEDNTYYDEMDGLGLPGSVRVTPFVVPENYFSQLTNSIKSHVKLEEHTHDVSAQAWNVPAGYFEMLSDNIISQVRIDKLVKEPEADVPAEYFEGLSARIQTAIFESKLKESISTTGFTTPDQHDENLRDRILSQTIKKEVKQPVLRQLHLNRWVQFAAAACVTLVIGITSYNSINNRMDEDYVSSQHLTSIPDEEIINYLSALNDSHDVLYIMECFDHDHSHDSNGVCTHVKENDIEDYLNYAL